MDIQAENKKEFGIPKSAMAIFSVASVLFSAHAGGGFATGNQENTYFVSLGWSGIISLVLAMFLLTMTMREAISCTTNSTLNPISSCLKNFIIRLTSSKFYLKSFLTSWS